MPTQPRISASARIETYILERIQDGTYGAGDRLPSESELAELFKVSRIPVRQAVERLVSRCTLNRIHGKGMFVRNTAAPQLRTGRIGVLYWPKDSGFFTSSFYTGILAGIEAEAARGDHLILLRSFRRDAERDPGSVLRALAESVDGLIVLDMIPYIYRAVEATLRTLDKPVVVLNFDGAAADIDSVILDNYAGGRSATEFLLRAGHRRIACVYRLAESGGAPVATFGDRLRGYRDALVETGLTVDERLCLALPPTTPSGPLHPQPAPANLEAARQLLTGDDRPTAVFCVSDNLALAMYRSAEAVGLRVPEDLSIMGFDDVPEAGAARPPLTTMHSPLAEMGAVSFRRLLERLNETPDAVRIPYRAVLPVALVIRESHTMRSGTPEPVASAAPKRREREPQPSA